VANNSRVYVPVVVGVVSELEFVGSPSGGPKNALAMATIQRQTRRMRSDCYFRSKLLKMSKEYEDTYIDLAGTIKPK